MDIVDVMYLWVCTCVLSSAQSSATKMKNTSGPLLLRIQPLIDASKESLVGKFYFLD